MALCVACSPREGAVPATRGPERLAPAQQQQNVVSFLDRRLGERLSVESTDSRRSASGTLEVWAVLRNRTQRALQIEGRSRFVSTHEGVPEDTSAWRRVFLETNSVGTYRESSTRAEDIAYYVIELREGK
jgi:hypothetical protein